MVRNEHLLGFTHQHSSELASEPVEFLLGISDSVVGVYAGILHAYLCEKLLQ